VSFPVGDGKFYLIGIYDDWIIVATWVCVVYEALISLTLRTVSVNHFL
jgi:hypothetical protein